VSLGREYLADHAYELDPRNVRRKKVEYSNAKMLSDTRVRTDEVRLSYEHLTRPYANPNSPGQDPRYSVTILIPKEARATKAYIDKAMAAAYEKAVAERWKGARPQLRNALIYDGDGFRNDGSRFGPECAGHWVITASSKRRPGVVYASDRFSSVPEEEIYSGMYAFVTLNFFSFDVSGNRGIGCGLGNVAKTRDGDPFSGGPSAEDDFEGLEQPSAGFQQAPAQRAYPQAGGMGYQPQMSGYAATAGVQQAAQPQLDPITGQPDPFAGIPGIPEDLPFT